MKKKEVEYKKGRIGEVVSFICSAYKLDEGHVRASILLQFPELKDRSACFNCGMGLEIQVYKADLLNALFLLAMGRVVRNNLLKGEPFTEANKVHVPTLEVSDAVRKRETQCDYLNFVKQPDNLRRTGYWVITNWGWKALRGEPVPKQVKYWRGNLLGRSEETITIGSMFHVHREEARKAAALRDSVKGKADYSGLIGDYDPNDWAEVDGFVASEEFNNPSLGKVMNVSTQTMRPLALPYKDE